MTKKEMYLEPEVKVVNLRLSSAVLTVSNYGNAPDYTVTSITWDDNILEED